jgi:hypothetical protein
VRSRVAAVELTLSEAELSSGREGIAVLHTLKRYPAEMTGSPLAGQDMDFVPAQATGRRLPNEIMR